MTSVFHIGSGDSDEALFAPLGSPGVLDLPEIGARLFIGAVADSEHAVVELLTALLVEDAARVELEFVVHGNGDGDGLDVQGSFHLSGGVLGNVLEATHSESGIVSLALTVTTGVGIVGFEGNAVFLDVLEGSVHHSTVATHVAVLGTVDQGLFGEFGEVAVFDEVEAFQGADSGESPAGSALALVLDVSDSAFLDPVDGVGLAFVAEDILDVTRHGLNVAGFKGGELFEGEIHVLVLGQSVGEFLGVVLINQSEVFFENFESLVLFGGAIFLIVLLLPNLEFGQKGVLSELGLRVFVGRIEVKTSGHEGEC